MNILITGVNGFIATALWNYLKTHKSSLEVSGTDIKLRNSASSQRQSIIQTDRQRSRYALKQFLSDSDGGGDLQRIARGLDRDRAERAQPLVDGVVAPRVWRHQIQNRID